MLNYNGTSETEFGLLKQIEQTREKLNSEVDKLSCLNPSVIELSQDLDKLLNLYFQVSQENKNNF